MEKLVLPEGYSALIPDKNRIMTFFAACLYVGIINA